MHYLFLLLSVFAVPKHDFHVSITNAELNTSTNSLQISMKLFTDDLEDAIKDAEGIDLNLTGKKEHHQADSVIYNYVLRHFSIKNAGQTLPINFIGREMEQDITFIYLEIPQMPAVKSLQVRNTIFFDRFGDQSNIVNIEVRDNLQSAFLEQSKPQMTLHFD